MEIKIIDKEKMKVMESLAKTNLEVSAMKATLADLKKDEDDYIAKREKKALSRIEVLLKDSNDTLNDAYKNYNDIHNLSKSSSEFVAFLTEAHDDVKSLVEAFDRKTEAWEENIKGQEDKLKEVRKKILVDQVQLKNDQTSIDVRNKEIALEKRKLRDERGTLERAITRLKENNI